MLSDMERIAAIAAEARRRGTSYGQLVQQLTEDEQEKIYKDFERGKKKKK